MVLSAWERKKDRKKEREREKEKSSCVPPNQYKAPLGTTKVYVGTHVQNYIVNLDFFVLFEWIFCVCAIVHDGAQRRSMVHNLALYCWSGAQHSFHKPFLYASQNFSEIWVITEQQISTKMQLDILVNDWVSILHKPVINGFNSYRSNFIDRQIIVWIVNTWLYTLWEITIPCILTICFDDAIIGNA